MRIISTAVPEETACTIDQVLREVRSNLQAAGIDSAEQEALWLVEHALGLSPLQQVVDRDRQLSEKDFIRVRNLVARRAEREPLQYILGTQEFCGLTFEVNPSVLIPRPETELLVRETVRRLTVLPEPTVVDIGTGSGCLAVTLARSIPDGNFFAVDISSAALETAKQNARRHGVESSITWLTGDLLAPLSEVNLKGAVNVIVSNPPYIRESDWSGLQPEVKQYEPRAALIGGQRGTEFHERVLDEAIPYLAPGALVIMELGLGQSVQVQSYVRANPAYSSIDIVPDSAGIDRVLVAQRSR